MTVKFPEHWTEKWPTLSYFFKNQYKAGLDNFQIWVKDNNDTLISEACSFVSNTPEDLLAYYHEDFAEYLMFEVNHLINMN